MENGQAQENLPAIMGMAAALKEECTLMEQNEAKVTACEIV